MEKASWSVVFVNTSFVVKSEKQEMYYKNLMNSACMYLINSDKNILEISSILGYTDAYTFSHAFKKSIGVSPTHYRNSNSNPPIDY